ncbi:MAG: RDD family protein [Bacilli bacterium]|nr:RDD family protein [Bacilli bacterium]
MRATLTLRAAAWIVDLIIVLVILFFIGLIYKPDISGLVSAMDLITVSYAEGSISFSDYILSLSEYYKKMDEANIVLNVINVIVLLGYFVFLPYFNNGKTLGKMFNKIEVKAQSNQELAFWQLLFRNLIINGLFYLIMVIFCTLIIPSEIYFVIITCLGIIQIILILISVLMVIYRKDRKALHDMFSKSWVACYK